MRCRAHTGEVVQILTFLGLGCLILALAAVSSWLRQHEAATAGVGLILAVWLTVLAHILRRPIDVALIGERRLRFRCLIGSFDAPVQDLRLITTLREKDGWKTVRFYFRHRRIESWPLHHFSRLTQTLQTVQPTIEVRNTDE
jgi:hypothetical protein